MGTISSGTGLISGLNITSIVTQLMAIEKRPLDSVNSRVETTKQQQAAYLSLNASLLAVKSAVSTLARPTLFTARKATSSNETVLTATAKETTPIDNYSFTVRSLVSSHQLVSRGFHDQSSTPVGTGTLTFESTKAQVAPRTLLNDLNDGAGIRRGVIRITDRSGVSADIDLRAATSVDDVLQAINSQSKAGVHAATSGDHIIITDTTGATTSDLRIIDLNGGCTAADLGIARSSTSGRIEGDGLVTLSETTRLSRLNDGVGMRFNTSSADLRFSLADGSTFDVDLTGNLSFNTKLAELNDGNGVRLGTIRITNRRGVSRDIDLSAAKTMQDVKSSITAAGIDVEVTSISSGRLVISDTTGSTTSNLKIEDVTGHAAADMGIEKDIDNASFTGTVVYRMETLASVFRAIENAQGNDGKLTATVSDNGIVLTDHTSGAQTTRVEAINGSLAARDLGLLGGFDGSGTLRSRDLIAGLNTVLLTSLHGGQGIETGEISFTRRDGSTFSLDFTGAQNLSDVLRIINEDGRLAAQVDSGGTRIRISDSTQGSGTLSADGAMATAMGLTATGDGRLTSDDLQLQYISENTRLADLNQGKGIAYGTIKITASDGTSKNLTLTSSLHKTVGDVLTAIQDLGLGIKARINANGDGIELEDTLNGTQKLTVTQEGTGTTAKDLGILGTANAVGVLTGSFAITIAIGGADTLDKLVEKINQSGAGLTASIISDGMSDNPYRMILTSKTTGTQGQIAYSATGDMLSLDVLSQAQDATVIIGNSTSANPIVVSSSSNTLSNVVPGLTLNLLSTSDSPVQVTVEQDIDTIVSNVKTFIKTYNDALDQIRTSTKYIPNEDDPTKSERGVLLGEATVRTVESQITRLVTATVSNIDSTLKQLGDVGIMVDSTGGQTQLTLSRTLGADSNNSTTIDGEAKLRAALRENPEAVKKLFTLVETNDNKEPVYTGLAARMEQELGRITRQVDGTLTREYDKLQNRVDLLQEQASDMEDLLAKKEARLYKQFQSMETALANLQTQQSALSALSSLTNISSYSYSNSK